MDNFQVVPGPSQDAFDTLNSNITNTTTEELTTASDVVSGKLVCIRRLNIINLELDGIKFSTAGNHTVAYLPAYAHDGRGNSFLTVAGTNVRLVGITSGGTLTIYGAEANVAYYGNVVIIK